MTWVVDSSISQAVRASAHENLSNCCFAVKTGRSTTSDSSGERLGTHVAFTL